MFKRNKTVGLILLLLLIATGLQAQRKVAAGEYFWDTDPGQGNGTAVTAVDGAFDSMVEQALATISSLPSITSHVFNIRMKDGINHWGPVFRTTVQVLPNITSTRAIKVTAAETFWDTDPGQGNGTAMLAFDGNFNDAVETVVKSALSIPAAIGVHTLNIRCKDAAGLWSSTFKVNIDCQAAITTTRAIKVTAAEYYWDTDPGQGNGTPLLAFDGNFDQATEVIYKNMGVGTLSVGVHLLCMRVRDAANNWGPVFSTVVDRQKAITTVRPINISSAEYFFDTDPGNGNATPMIAFDGNFNSAVEAISGASIPQPVLQGYHTLYMRSKDVAGGWGTKFGVVVNVDTSINTFATNINGTFNFCSPVSNPQSYSTPITGGNSYSWSVLGGNIVSGQGTNAISVNWNGTGFHSITVIECNSGQTLCDTSQHDVYVYTSQTSNTSAGICQGDSVLFNGGWIKNAGSYQQVTTTVHGCDSTINFTLSVYPTYHINNIATIALGDSIFLAGGWVKTPGTYTDHFTTSHSCDSTVVTTLTVNFASAINGPTSLCQSAASNILYTATLHAGSSYNWQVNGGSIVGSAGINSIRVTWTNPGNNDITLIECNSNNSFCDTLVYPVLISNGIVNTVNSNICQGDSVFAQGHWQHNTGTFRDTIPTGTGCDTIIVTNLNVYPNYSSNNNIVINSGDSAFAAGAWQHATGVYPDHYQTVHGCDSTIVTYLLVITGLEEIDGHAVLLVPNPSDNAFQIDGLSGDHWTIQLYNSQGQCLYVKHDFRNKDFIETGELAPGIYLLNMQNEYHNLHQRIEVIH